MWVRAMDVYGRVSREIEPKKAGRASGHAVIGSVVLQEDMPAIFAVPLGGSFPLHMLHHVNT